MKRVLCVWLPNWPLQRILVARAELRGRPIVLYQAGRRGLQVLTCCAAAARRGVYTGMPVAEARGLYRADVSVPGAGEQGALAQKSLAQKSLAQEPCFERHDPQADLAALERLACWCRRFSPTVGREEAPLPDSLLLDVTGCVHLFHSEERLAGRIVAELARRGLRVRVAVAGTIGAAWALARYRSHSVNSPHPGPLPEGDPPHPGPLPEGDPPHPGPLPEGEGEGAHDSPISKPKSEILDLPVEALRLDEQTVRTLRELDIGSIAQLEALPRASLPSRLGPQVIRRLDQALGRVAERIVPVQPQETVAACQTFEHPLVQRAALEIVLRQLAGQILGQLAGRAAGVQRLEVRLAAADRKICRCSVGFIRPCTEAAHLVQMILARLARLPVPGEIVQVHLRVTAAVALGARQVSLLAEPQQERARKQLARLLEQLSSRLGERRVLRPRLRPDVQPEYAFCWETAVSEAEVRSLQTGVGSTLVSGCFSSRPLYLRARPVPVTVLTAVQQGPPIRFRWEGRDYVVARSWGPERIVTGWWRSLPIRRDYYRIETDQGQQLWLFRRGTERDWFLQGEFC